MRQNTGDVTEREGERGRGRERGGGSERKGGSERRREWTGKKNERKKELNNDERKIERIKTDEIEEKNEGKKRLKKERK